MALLIYALLAVLVLALCIYALDLAPIDPRLRTAAKVILVVIAILLIVNRAGGL